MTIIVDVHIRLLFNFSLFENNVGIMIVVVLKSNSHPDNEIMATIWNVDICIILLIWQVIEFWREVATYVCSKQLNIWHLNGFIVFDWTTSYFDVEPCVVYYSLKA